MKPQRFFITKICVLFIALLASCNKWVDLPPKDRLTQTVLFSTKEGYLKALVGIYSEFNNTSLYGRDLTMGMLDAMAQYYNMGDAEHSLLAFSSFDYESDTFKSRANTIWTKFYNLIANSNAILDQCKEGNTVLPTQYFGMIKGETLALRAMMHFDLLRMFGPIYDKEKDKPCIPYIESSDRSVQPLISSVEVIGKVIRDLEEAQKLLQNTDPVLTQGALNFAGEINNHFNYRQYRLNYFAVTALLARAHLWSGNKEKALQYAKEVIDKGQRPEDPFFPFVTLEEVRPSNPDNVSDRMFSKEVLFSCYNQSRTTSYNALFSPSLSATSLLTFSGTLTDGRITSIYDNQNDFRRSFWATRSMAEDKEVLYFNKYEELISKNNTSSDAFRFMIPLIRISEMYFIVAESSTDLQEAGEYLNKLRLNRGLAEMDFTNMDQINLVLENEYLKEFMGEGQMFYFFKRKAYTELPEGSKIAGGTIPMQLSSYTFPLPESETSQRQ